MNLGMRTAAWSGGKKMPYDSEVEYLTMPDGAYLDSGILFDNTISRFDLTFIARGRIYVMCEIVGAYCDYFRVCRVQTNSNVSLVSGFDTDKISVSLSSRKIGEVVTATIKGINGYKIIGHSGIPAADQPLLIGASCEYTYPSGVNPKITANNGHTVEYLGYKAYKDEGLVMDAIPVRKDGVGYMFDKISGEFRGNIGTGAFIIGPDKT